MINSNSIINKPNESLEGAKLLFENKAYDSAVSRAYFACYQYALIALDQYKKEQYPICDARKHSHKSITSAFSRYLIKGDNIYPDEIKSYLKELQEHRHTADYEPAYSFDKKDTELILKKAIHFCNTIKSKLN
ncbi:HEPN domain-containing protein [Candidatus Parabeggiatoa sp. HSG14]|uniref:HEPN domain-containing protein n=1 Tax=Candidatus Parabeggiatoa sp. HSG14 TaxID=3055593 RepID=UPI0025A6DD21|nr:HEPN domain-containing protein [Thiotrichales bacterium HSG14]